MMFFEIFEDLKFLKIFDPQPQIFKNTLLAAEISADPKILGVTTLGPRKSPDMHVRIFSSLFCDILNFMSIFTRKF